MREVQCLVEGSPSSKLYQLSSPTHNVEQSKSCSHIAYAMAFPGTEKDSEIFHMDSRWMLTELLKTHSSQLSDSATAAVALGCVCSFLQFWFFFFFWLHWSSCNAWASLVAACGLSCSMGFLGGKESTCQCRRHRFDTWVREDPLEEDMAIHTSILARRISWTEDPDWLQSTGSQRVSQD